MLTNQSTRSCRHMSPIRAVHPKNWVLAFIRESSAAVKLFSQPASTALEIGIPSSILSSLSSSCRRRLREWDADNLIDSTYDSVASTSFSGKKTVRGWPKYGSRSFCRRFWVKHASRDTNASGLVRCTLERRLNQCIPTHPCSPSLGNTPPKQQGHLARRYSLGLTRSGGSGKGDPS